MSSKNLCFYFLFSLLLNNALYADNKDPISNVIVSIERGDPGSYILKGHFDLEASTTATWAVLTDYDHMATFVSSIRSSKLIHQIEKGWLVEQVMSGKAGFLKKRVHLLLDVQESPPEKIAFSDLSKRSFKSYVGAWEILKLDKKVGVDYKLFVTPAFLVPDFIALRAFRNNVRVLLEEVRAEILKRGE